MEKHSSDAVLGTASENSYFPRKDRQNPTHRPFRIHKRTPLAPISSPSSPLPKADASTISSRSLADHYAFTPTVSRTAPRAWDRRPATPFAPRNESHKIWKRFETVNKNKYGGRRSAVERDMWRAVKRRKVGEVHETDKAGKRGWADSFVGTTYEQLEKVERRTKLARAVRDDVSCDAVERARNRRLSASLPETNITSPLWNDVEDSHNCGPPAAGQKKEDDGIERRECDNLISADSLPTLAVGGRSCAPKIAATIDGNASPGSLKDDEAIEKPSWPDDCGAIGKGQIKVQKKRQLQKTRNGKSATEEQIVTISCDNPVAVVDEVVQNIPKIGSKGEGDDTENSHAFLPRARAKKNPMTTKSPEKQVITGHPKSTASSSRTRSQAALAKFGRNSSSPQKARKLQLQAKKADRNSTTLSTIISDPPLRKSNRIRLPQAERHQLATPSSIPLRRSDVTNLIVIHKNETQHLAIKTRANTRRNRGESVQAKTILEAISAQAQSSPVKAARKKNNKKQVCCDEGLAFSAPHELPASQVDEETRAPKTPVKRNNRAADERGIPVTREWLKRQCKLGTP